MPPYNSFTLSFIIHAENNRLVKKTEWWELKHDSLSWLTSNSWGISRRARYSFASLVFISRASSQAQLVRSVFIFIILFVLRCLSAARKSSGNLIDLLSAHFPLLSSARGLHIQIPTGDSTLLFLLLFLWRCVSRQFSLPQQHAPCVSLCVLCPRACVCQKAHAPPPRGPETRVFLLYSKLFSLHNTNTL